MRILNRRARGLLQILSVGSIGVGKGLCVVRAHMQSHDLAGLRIHPKNGRVVDDFYRLGIGIDFPVLRQGVFNDEGYRRGGHILKKVLLLRNRDRVALPHAVPKSFLDMVRSENALKVTDGVVILQIQIGIVRERVALILQNLAAPVDMNFLERSLRLSGSGGLRNRRKRSEPQGDSYA